MDEFKFMVRCDMCGREFQMGPHVYEGKYIKRYKLNACDGCFGSNWDGWGPFYEEQFVAHLVKLGIPIPERNIRGWYPRE